MASSKEIKRRIKSVKNIGQITKALELISAAKMRKAQAQALASRPYSVLTSELLQNLASRVDAIQHPLLDRVLPAGEPASDKVLLIMVAPDRGLAGAVNANLYHQALNVIRAEGAAKIDVVSVGKKGAEFARRQGLSVVAQFESKDRNLSAYDAKPIAQVAIEEFLQNKVSKVFVVYTGFVSTLVQRPNMIQLLPFARVPAKTDQEYLFEPSADAVWDKLIYRAVEFTVYQSLVEALASEHSARMVAMRNANEAATDLVNDLQLSYNQARQASITRELAEISAAKLAMEG